MAFNQSDVLDFIQENDVKFIRLAFCDMFGVPKNIAIMADELPRVFRQGMGFDASAVEGFMKVTESDLLLYPDPDTLMVLPWRPTSGRVVRLFCDICHPDKRPFAGDGRHLLRGAVERAAASGLVCQFGVECEFYLFETDELGHPTQTPHDNAGYLDFAPLDKGENVRREICLTLEEMGIPPQSSHHEQGPGQNEVDFHYSDPLSCADNLATFKTVVRTVADRNGLFASFMPKPLAEASGSGMHINISLQREGKNLFAPDTAALTQEARSFVAGVLAHVPELTVFLNPATNSYARLGCCEAPAYVSWSRQNRSQLLRLPEAAGHSRLELRSADPLCNPYLAFTLLLEAGLEGIRQGLELEAPTNINLDNAEPALQAAHPRLPADLNTAIALARNSSFAARVLSLPILEQYLVDKEKKWQRYQAAEDQAEFERICYFGAC